MSGTPRLSYLEARIILKTGAPVPEGKPTRVLLSENEAKVAKAMSKARELTETLAGQIRMAGLPEPVREARFHAKRRWRWDLSWPAERVAVECDGGTWKGGRHSQGTGFESDCEKANEGQLLGWLVLRATTNQVKDGRALAWIERALKARAR